MAAVNYRGVDAVCSYIDSTNLRYFGIFPAGQRSAKPLYTQKENVSTAKAVDKFRTWAGFILQGDPGHSLAYELRMYDSKEVPGGDDEILSGRSGLSVTFIIGEGQETARISGTAAAPAPAMGGISMDMYLQLLTQKTEADRRADRLEYENADLREQIIALEEELEETGGGDGDEVSGINGLANMVMPMIMKHMGGGAAPAINGVPGSDHQGCDCERCEHISPLLMDAIGTLKKHDPDLDTHVVKLAKIAATNPGMWAFLTQSLDNQ